MIAKPITLTGDEVGEAMRAVHLVLMDLRAQRDHEETARAHMAPYFGKVPQTLIDRIARLEALDKRLSAATDGKDA